MDEELVYVILVNYRAADETLECVSSLKRQSYENVQIIIVDNDFIYNCGELIHSKWSDVKVIVNSENIGFAKANNIGIAYAIEQQANFILILNNDTVVEENFVKKMIDFYHSHTSQNIGIISGKILYHDDRKRIWHAGGTINFKKGSADIIGFREFDKGQYDASTDCSFASGCCMFIPVEVINKCGMMNDEYFLYYEDLDYCCRIINKGYRIFSNNNALVYHKESVSTKKGSPVYSYYFSRNRFMFIKKSITGFNKLLSYVYTVLWLVKKVVKRELQFEYVWMGIVDFKHGIMYRKDFF